MDNRKIKSHRKLSKGAYYADWLNISNISKTKAQAKSGRWYLARPLPYYSFIIRLRQALDVLRYRADALYWGIDLDK